MEKEVNISDREKEVEVFRIACVLSNISIDYPSAELLLELKKRLDSTKNSLTADDVWDMKRDWQKKWDKYFEKTSSIMNQNVIILTNGKSYEAWGSLVEICKEKGFSHNYLKRFKFPFKYKGLEFIRVPFRSSNGC